MHGSNGSSIAKLRVYIVAIGMLFSLGTALSLIHAIHQIRAERRALALSQANMIGRTIFVARRWAMEHGRVPAPVEETLPGGTAVAATAARERKMFDGDRDDTDHVSMTQFIGKILRPDGFDIHIVSRKPSGQRNLSNDDWDRAYLEKTSKAGKAEWALTGPPGKRVFRYMEPLKVDAACLRCHGQQGYKIGDVPGAIRISFPYEVFDRSAQRAQGREILTHALTLGIVVGVLFFLGRRMETLMENLRETQRQVRTLEGILPMCSNCKKVRKEGAAADDPAAWVSVDSYITGHSEALVSHGICPECMEKLYGPGGGVTGSKSGRQS